MCDFHEPYFGANYPDACCIDGYLWDLDSCDEPGGPLHSGGDDPCPQCNHEAFMDRVLEDCEERGWLAADASEPRIYAHHKVRYEQERDEACCREAWFRGYDQRAKEFIASIGGER